jgi:thymidine kinase
VDTDDVDDVLACLVSGDGRLRHGAVLKYFYGPMGCGKSTLALQLDHNHTRQGRVGMVVTRLDRAGPGRVSSRIGLGKAAVEIDVDTDLRTLVRDRWAGGGRCDYVIADEVHFYTEAHVEQLVELVDVFDVDVYAFGWPPTFAPGSSRRRGGCSSCPTSWCACRWRCCAGVGARAS